MIDQVQKKGGDKLANKVKSKWSIFSKNSTPSSAVSRPMKNMNSTKPEKKGIAKKFQKSDKNEIFVDIFEKLSVSIFLPIFSFYQYSTLLTGTFQPKWNNHQQSN